METKDQRHKVDPLAPNSHWQLESVSVRLVVADVCLDLLRKSGKDLPAQGETPRVEYNFFKFSLQDNGKEQ